MKHDIIISVASALLACLLYAGLTGDLENFDDKLFNAGIDIWEIVQ